MLGLQLRDSKLTQNVVEYCFGKGIIHGWTLHSNSLVRIAPPFIIEEELLEKVFSDHFGWGGNVLLSRFACWSYYPYKLSALI